MAKVIWSEPALNDIDNIAHYIALDNKSAAKNLVKTVFNKVNRLEDHPRSGRKPKELGKQDRFREIIVGPCRIFYRFDEKNVYIIFVMRSERLLHRYLIDSRLRESP